MNIPRLPCATRLGLAMTLPLILCSTSLAGTGTIMFIVVNSASLTVEETAKKTLMTAWGYTVNPITATASQATYDAAALVSSAAYISETVTSSDVGTKLTNATIPVVNEEAALSDELGFSASMTTFSSNQINITNTSHYITSTFAMGNRAIFSSSQPIRYLSGALGGYTALARQVATSNDVLAVFDRADTLTPSGTAAGKRVFLPFGNTGYDPNSLTTDGLTLMQRSIEWALLPVAHWKLDDAAGTTAVDWIGAHNGTLSGPTWTAGKIAGGLQLNGASDYVTIPDHVAFRVTNALTIAGWIKGNSWNPDGNWASPILRKGDANPCNWQLEVSGGVATLCLDDYDLYGIRGNTTLALNKWYHIAGTWDGATVRVYVNGVLDMTPAARAAPITTDTRPVYLGGRMGATDVTDGSVDDVRFYNRCLTAAEIAALAKAKPTMQTWQQVSPP